MWCGVLGWCRARGVWYSGTVHARRVGARGAFLCRDARARCSRVAAVPSPLVYFERRIAGFARVHRDLISNIYNYGTVVVLTTKNRQQNDIDNKGRYLQQNVFRSDQHHTARSRMDTVRDANRTAAVEHQYTHRAHSRACRIPDAVGHPCEAPTTAHRIPDALGHPCEAPTTAHRIPDALGHPCVIPVKRPPRRH